MHTTKVRFNSNDSLLFTLGGTDRALVQWSVSGQRTLTISSVGDDNDDEYEWKLYKNSAEELFVGLFFQDELFWNT